MRRHITLLGLLLLSSGVLAQSVTTIQLQNRPAEEVIPIVQPMLGPDDAISGQGFRIFLKSSPDTVALVRDIVDFVDTAAKTLQILVFQGSEQDLAQHAINAGIRIEGDNASVEIGDGRGNSGAARGSAVYGTTNASGALEAVYAQRRLRDNPIHQVRVTEGNEAYIATGRQVPYFVGGATVGRRVVAGGVEYEDALTGFYVIPRLRGDSVMFELSAFKNSPSPTGPGNIDTQSATTTVTGRVGEWLLIGGTSEQIERTQSGIGTTTTTHRSDRSGIWIRAEIVE